MAKSKKQPHVQLLSPENYIRQKARNLPIYECLINKNWQKMGTVNIVIARIHANGNLTIGIYMVDLFCLGIRDTHFRFNTTTDEYEDLLDIMSENLDMEKVEYSLVHNILLAANEYATDLGFKPHKDFTSVTQYLLEEDTDDIELIEIECGKDGKPLFIQSELITDAEANRIIKQLEKAVGKGNFDVLSVRNEMDDEQDMDEELELEDFDMWEYDKKIALFNDLISNGLDEISDDDKKRLIALTDSIYVMDICNEDEVDDIYNSWYVETEMEINEENYSAELLSQEPGFTISEQDEMEWNNVEMLINEEPEKVEQALQALKKKWGDIPYLTYMELKNLKNNNYEAFEQKVMDYCNRFSDFPLLKLEKYLYQFVYSKKPETFKIIEFEDIFEDRDSITELDMYQFQTAKLIYLTVQGTFEELEAMNIVLDDFNIKEEHYNFLYTMLILTRITALQEHLENNK